jgi:hypothetical protein
MPVLRRALMRDSVALGESSITRNSIADSGSAPFIVAADVLFLAALMTSITILRIISEFKSVVAVLLQLFAFSPENNPAVYR